MTGHSVPQSPFLELRGATFRLGEAMVFSNTSWRWLPAEQWALVGPNASGKSVLADALRGRLPLVAGEFRYGFRVPSSLSLEDTIGYVSFDERKREVHETVVQSRWNSIEEESALRVEDYLSFERVMDINPYEVNPAAEVMRTSFQRRRRSAIRLLKTEPFLDRTLLSLSNGERQRLEMTRALCRPLRLLILDEPFSGLDSQARRRFRALIQELLKTRLRVLFITARPEEIPGGITHLLEVEQLKLVRARRRPSADVQRRKAPPKRIASPLPSVTSIHRRQDHHRAPTLVELRNLTVGYGQRVILRQLNWTIREHQSWALLGTNGSGKSTLLSVIMGDHPQAYSNEVLLFGKAAGTGESIWDVKRHIGWVSPELQTHFDPMATCLEVVVSGFYDTIGLFRKPAAWQKTAARRWLCQFGLADEVATPLTGLSTGLQRMALLARALVKTPKLLLLDEPCQGLDSKHRDLFVQAVDGFVQAGITTTVFVTHRTEEIPRSITRVLRLGSGGRAASVERHWRTKSGQ